MMCWCTVSDFSSFILLFCTLATVYFCFFLFCLFVCFVYGRGRGLHAALVGVAPLFQVWGAKIQMFFSDWEGCGVTNDINERLMQTHINLFFLSLSKMPIFSKIVWSFYKIMLVVVPDWHSTMIHFIKWWNNLKQILGVFWGQNIGGRKKWAITLKIFSFRKIKQICWDNSF